MNKCSEVIKPWYEVTPAQPFLLKPDKKSKRIYESRVDAFDIEAYTFKSDLGIHAVMYQWQYQSGLGSCYMGRTWTDFREFLSRYSCGYGNHEYIVVYVHNLSYEFQFLKGVIPVTDLFAKDKRTVVRFTSGRYEFRCSYVHSNMSLDVFTRRFKASHGKLSGSIDYRQEYWPDTPLDEQHVLYGANDVKGLVEALMNEMEGDADTNATIPLTSTGYVRREARAALRVIPKFYREDWKPSYAIYRLSRQAFRGGDTHANRYYAGKILTNVKSADRSSSYLDSLTMRKYPVGKWEERVPDFKNIEVLLTHKRPFLARVVLVNVSLKDIMFGAPYIPFDKVRGARNYAKDNGRILEADILETTVTDIDFKIICREYVFSFCQVKELYSSHYRYLPQSYVELVHKYYERKTALKGVEGDEIYYEKMKNRANSMYGLTAQNPVRDKYKFVDGLIEAELAIEENEYDGVKPLLPYVWGVWCTAHAREALHEAIHACGEGFVYCDTDSVKYVGECDLSAYNAKTQALAEERGSVAIDHAGAAHYMGVYEEDGDYERFITWGAKKYAYEKGGKVYITIAGVNKAIGAQELTDAGGLEALVPGFVFRAAAGQEASYNDLNTPLEYTRRDGVKITITSNLGLTDSTYTLGLSADYEALISQYCIDISKDNVYNEVVNNL